jgi:hypothetical protein
MVVVHDAVYTLLCFIRPIDGTELGHITGNFYDEKVETNGRLDAGRLDAGRVVISGRHSDGRR